MSDDAPVWSPAWRNQAIDNLQTGHAVWDILIVGGGITGAGIYREATRLGLKVLLVEQRDFAWGTSSRSSKMVHGGLRYLGSGQFGLASHSVKERQSLLKELPGLVNPLPFMMGHYKGKFPGPWIFDKLLAIYDWMAGQRLRRFYNKGIGDFLVPGLNRSLLKGVTQFADAVTDDARLVMRVLHEGNDSKGTALNYLKAVDTLRESGKVNGVRLEDQLTNKQFDVSAKVVVNASGAWTDTLRETLGKSKSIRPLRGSHLLVPFWRLPVSYAISFFHSDDKRPVFVFPWEGVTVIGTTDLDHKQNMNNEAEITVQEVEYLLSAANQQFPELGLSANDIRASWSGVRPVVSKNQNESVNSTSANNPSDEKREHVIWDDDGLISVAGGKLTTFRLIALDVMNKAMIYLPQIEISENSRSTDIFAKTKLPQNGMALSSEQKQRLLGRYGRHAFNLITDAEQEDLSKLSKIGTTDTLWAEVIWCCRSESVLHLDDLLLRRTRIGLLLREGGKEVIQDVKKICKRYLNWDDEKWCWELDRYYKILKQSYGLPDALQTNGIEQ